jgi:hypothetical protein
MTDHTPERLALEGSLALEPSSTEHRGRFYFMRAFLTTFAILTAVSAFIAAWMVIWALIFGGLYGIGSTINDEPSQQPTCDINYENC